MGGNGGKWGEMGGNGGKWRKMGENGKLLQIHHGKCMKLFQQERKMEENGAEMGGKWVKNGTRAGPIFPKGNLLPHRAVNKKPGIQVSGWKNGENGGIRRYPENWILPRLDPRTPKPYTHTRTHFASHARRHLPLPPLQASIKALNMTITTTNNTSVMCTFRRHKQWYYLGARFKRPGPGQSDIWQQAAGQ